MLEELFKFLGDESAGRALTLIGGAIAALCLAGWAIFKHVQSRHIDNEPTKTVTLTIEEYRNWLVRESPERGEESAEVQRKLENPEAAIATAQEKIRELEATFAAHDISGEDYFSEERKAFRSGDIAGAERKLQAKQIEFEPVLKRASDLYLGLAVIAEQKVDWRAAAKFYSRSAVLFESEENLIRAAVFLWRCGAVEEAYVISRKILEVYKSQYGARDERVAGILNNLAAQLHDMGQIEEAKSTLIQALSIRDELKLPRDEDYAGALSNLGNMFLIEEDYPEAVRLQRECLDILSRLESDPSPTIILAVRNSLAEALRLNGEREEAEAILEINYRETLDKRGADHPDTARALNFLAKLQSDLGKIDSSARNLMEALRIQRAALGDYHPNSIAIGLSILELQKNHPAVFKSKDLSEIETRYRPVLQQYRNLSEDG